MKHLPVLALQKKVAAATALALALLCQPPTAAADQATAYLWSVRRGCQADPILEEATLSRIRGVGRQIIVLNVPASPETRSCSGKSCADIARRTSACAGLNGPLLGAELDEVQGPSGVVTRIRAWRYDLNEAPSASLFQEYLTCPAEQCGYRELQETVAKAINRLLDRAPGAFPESSPQTAALFPAPECLRLAEGMTHAVLPAQCEQPFAAACSTAELTPPEPSGRRLTALPILHHPRTTPQRWEWLPITGAVIGLAASISLGVANEFVKVSNTGGDIGNVLTPAFWVSSALTVVLGASSVAVVGDRYRREMHSFKETSAPSVCSLLVDGGPAGKEL